MAVLSVKKKIKQCMFKPSLIINFVIIFTIVNKKITMLSSNDLLFSNERTDLNRVICLSKIKLSCGLNLVQLDFERLQYHKKLSKSTCYSFV